MQYCNLKPRLERVIRLECLAQLSPQIEHSGHASYKKILTLQVLKPSFYQKLSISAIYATLPLTFPKMAAIQRNKKARIATFSGAKVCWISIHKLRLSFLILITMTVRHLFIWWRGQRLCNELNVLIKLQFRSHMQTVIE